MSNLGKFLIITGVIFIILGLVLTFLVKFKVPFLGKLPGDIFIRRENFSFYFPLTSCLLISLILSLVFYFFFKR